jgi:putative flippase GtrA
MSNELVFKFIKFALVGFSGVFVDFGITWVGRERLKLNQYAANSAGFLAAVISNYVLNRIWTFHSNDPAIVVQFGKFAVVALVGLGMNNLIIYLLNGKGKLNFYVSKLAATGIVMIWNFGANYLFTFR